MENSVELISFGAAGTVTGSKHLIKYNGKKILIDCGLFQGNDLEKFENTKPNPDLLDVDAIVLTHGHLDHCGYIPALIKAGLRCPIYSTQITREIAREIQNDNAKIMAKELESPLYSPSDVVTVYNLYKTIEFEKSRDIFDDISLTLYPASHVLGASCAYFKLGDRTLLFSGDLGRSDDPLIEEYVKGLKADTVVLESTYGNRIHEDVDFAEVFSGILSNAIGNNRTVLIPAFSLARSQMMMYFLSELKSTNEKFSQLKIYVDSPLTMQINSIYEKYADRLKIKKEGWDELISNVELMQFTKQRQSLLKKDGPKVIISSGGMMSGGPIHEYLKRYISEESTDLLIVGYQAEGTLGKEIQGFPSTITMDGEEYTVKAKVQNLTFFSSHADQPELISWAKCHGPQHIYLIHGSDEALETLSHKFTDLNIPCTKVEPEKSYTF